MKKALEAKKYREVTPVGCIYAQGREYYLLSLHPINPDWEGEYFERRFAVVPIQEIDIDDENLESLYSYARHIIIAGSYLIEYKVTFDPIKVWDLGVIDLSEIDLEPEDLEEPDLVELLDVLREVEETNG